MLKYSEYLVRGRSNAATALKTLLALLFLALLMLATALASPARAQEATDQRAVGPVNPDNGFPFWFQDANGVRLDLCLEQNGLCLTEEPNPAQPISFPDNFGGEAFWWAAETSAPTVNGGNALLVLASEAAFANEEPVDGDQVAFGRIRIRIDNLDAGATYRVTHPYGEEIFENVAGGTPGINFTEDIGCFDIPCNETAVERALQSRVFGGFLTWDDNGQAPPPGYIGDPNQPHTVTGSPTGNNFFLVEKVEENAAGELVAVETHAESNLFSVMGKISALSAVATPTGGEFEEAQNVTLTASDNSDIFYTLDGSDPSDENNANREQYTGNPINIAQTSTLRYIVVDAESEQSQVFEQRYVITLPTDVSLNANPSTLDAGQGTTLSGQLSSAGGPLADKPVILEEKVGNANDFSQVGDPQNTDPEGNFSFEDLKPETSTAYRVSFAGEAEALKPSTSPVQQVTVNLLSSAINLNASRTPLFHGQATTLSGQLTSDGTPMADKQVILLQRPIGQQRFSRVPGGVLTTNTHGNFSKALKPQKNTVYRARFAGNAQSKLSTSAPKRVNVRVRITNATSTQNLKLGQTRIMRGLVAPAHNGKVVRITVSRGGIVVRAANVRLNNQSRYRFTYRPPRPGVYVVRARFAGDVDHLANVSPIKRFRVVR